MKISEINIIPIKPKDGVVGFTSFVLEGSLYLNSVAIITRPCGGYRLCYPTKKVGDKNIHIFHPIKSSLADQITNDVLIKYKQLQGNENVAITKPF